MTQSLSRTFFGRERKLMPMKKHVAGRGGGGTTKYVYFLSMTLEYTITQGGATQRGHATSLQDSLWSEQKFQVAHKNQHDKSFCNLCSLVQ
jgi:cytidylate kinase